MEFGNILMEACGPLFLTRALDGGDYDELVIILTEPRDGYPVDTN